MKTLIKTFTLAFAAAMLVWGCGQAPTPPVDPKILASSCNGTAYDTSLYRFDYDNINFQFVVYLKSNGAVECTKAVPTSGWVGVLVSGKDFFFDTSSPTMGAVSVTVQNTGVGDVAKIDIVRNNFKYPNLTHSGYILKIIGSDDGRNINNPSPPGGYIAVANAQESRVWIQRNSSASTYTFKQAGVSPTLAETSHTTAQVGSERYDTQGH